jgi:F0F1-type ATP synthase assembly protein I
MANKNDLLRDAENSAKRGRRPTVVRRDARRNEIAAGAATRAQKTARVASEKITRNVAHSKRTIVAQSTALTVGTVVGTGIGAVVGIPLDVVTLGATTPVTVAVGAAIGGLGTATLMASHKAWTQLVSRRFKRWRLRKPGAAGSFKTMRRNAYLLSHGDLFRIATSAQKSKTAYKAFLREGNRWSARRGSRSCADLVTLAYHFYYWKKRLRDGLAQSAEYERLVAFCQDATVNLRAAESQIQLTVMALCNHWCASLASPVSTTPVEDELPFLPWRSTLRRIRGRGKAQARRISRIAQDDLAKAAKKSRLVQHVKQAARSVPGWVANTAPGAAESVGEALIEEFVSVGLTAALDAPTLAGAGVSALGAVAGGAAGWATDEVMTRSLEFFNDKVNVKALKTERDFSKRIWMYRSVLEKGRLDAIAKDYAKLSRAVDKIDVAHGHAHDVPKSLLMTGDQRITLIVDLYETVGLVQDSIKHLGWLTKMVTEMGQYFTVYGQLYGVHRFRLHKAINDHTGRGTTCQGTCYCG